MELYDPFVHYSPFGRGEEQQQEPSTLPIILTLLSVLSFYMEMGEMCYFHESGIKSISTFTYRMLFTQLLLCSLLQIPYRSQEQYDDAYCDYSSRSV